MKKFFTIPLFFVFALFAFGQKEKIDSHDLKQFIRILSSDSLKGRGTGSREQEKAAKFIAERFKSLGLTACGDSGYYEKFKLKRTRVGEVYIQTKDKKFENFAEILYEGPVIECNEQEREVVFGGYGTEEELNKIQVEGRIVCLFVNNLRASFHYASILKNRGAYGVITANPQNEVQFPGICEQMQRYLNRDRFKLVSLTLKEDEFVRKYDLSTGNSVLIANKYVENIFNLSVDKLLKASNAGTITSIPVSTVRFKNEIVTDTVEVANICAMIKGKSDTSIIISAHYDHVLPTDSVYFPGADDNASGTAGIMELAEAFAGRTDLPYNLIFTAVTAEEIGLIGSYYHANKPGFDPTKVLCNLNLDMISRYDDKHKAKDNYIYCIGTGYSKMLLPFVKDAEKEFRQKVKEFDADTSDEEINLFQYSDQYSFYERGIPALLFIGGLHTDYHTPRDTYDKINYDVLKNRVCFIEELINQLQKEEN